MRQGIALRRAESRDLEAILTLLHSNELPMEGVPDWLSNFHLAVADGRIVGAAGYEVHGGHALLRSVVVDDQMRGLGVGERLVHEVLADLRASDIHDVYLLTTTADNYFPRFGFALTDRKEVPAALNASVEFSHACPATARVLHRIL